MKHEPFSFERSDRDLEMRGRALKWAIYGAFSIATFVSAIFLTINSISHPPVKLPELADGIKRAFMLYGLPQGGILAVLVFTGVFKQPAVRMLAASGQRGWMILCGVMMVLAIVAREVVGSNEAGRVVLQEVTLGVPCAFWAHWQMLRMEDSTMTVLPRFTMSTLLVMMFSLAAAGAAFVGT